MRLTADPHDSAETVRLRQLENERRMRPVFAVLALCAAFAIGAGAFTLPATMVVGAAAATVVLALVALTTQHKMRHSARPEMWLVAEHCTGVLAAGVVLAISGGLNGPAAGVIAVALALGGARFSGRTLILVSAGSIVWLLGSCWVADTAIFRTEMPAVYAWVATMVSVAALTTILAHSERAARADAVLDPLTGLLNRKALARRVGELEGQAAVSGRMLSVIACDVDGFKQVNDTAGHDTGDAVLQEIAYTMRKALRDFDLVYRVGGDEFLVVLPGAGAGEAAEIAERLRSAIDELDSAADAVSLSLGVASASGAEVVFDRLTAEADAALYRAKAGGRNRVAHASTMSTAA